MKSFLNAEKYVIISKYYLGNIHCLLSNNSHIYSLDDELLDLENSYYYEKYLMSSVCKENTAFKEPLSFKFFACRAHLKMSQK